MYKENLTKIDSIINYNPATSPANVLKANREKLYIMKSGNVVYQRNYADIDRILFYNPTIDVTAILPGTYMCKAYNGIKIEATKFVKK